MEKTSGNKRVLDSTNDPEVAAVLGDSLSALDSNILRSAKSPSAIHWAADEQSLNQVCDLEKLEDCIGELDTLVLGMAAAAEYIVRTLHNERELFGHSVQLHFSLSREGENMGASPLYTLLEIRFEDRGGAAKWTLESEGQFPLYAPGQEDTLFMAGIYCDEKGNCRSPDYRNGLASLLALCGEHPDCELFISPLDEGVLQFRSFPNSKITANFAGRIVDLQASERNEFSLSLYGGSGSYLTFWGLEQFSGEKLLGDWIEGGMELGLLRPNSGDVGYDFELTLEVMGVRQKWAEDPLWKFYAQKGEG